jgi:hypothetical protein
MQSLVKLYMIVLAALLLLATVPNGSLLAASPGATEKTTPQGEDAPGPDNGTAVPPSAENKGVITPPPIGDTGIHAQVPNPNAGTPEEVIPPPGTPGGNPDMQPR